MTVRVFFDPDRVAQLRQVGISPRRQLASASANEAKSALDLVEENTRLRGEIARLREEVARLTAQARDHGSHCEERELDDSSRRFSLIELDL